MRKLLLATGILIGFATSPAFATVIGPGGTGGPDSLVLDPAATLVDSVSGNFTGAGTGEPVGTFIESVYRNPTNSVAAGDLTWVIQITNSPSSTTEVERITASSFASFLTDVGIDTGTPPAGFVSSSNTPNSVNRDALGVVVGFNFTTPLAPGQSSAILQIDTNATQDGAGFLSVIDSGTATLSAFGTAVPEPASLALLGSGLLGLGLVRRRRRNT